MSEILRVRYTVRCDIRIIMIAKYYRPADPTAILPLLT